MRIYYSSSLLASGNPIHGRVGPVGIAINNQQVNDPAQIFRAEAEAYYGRARSNDLSFGVDCDLSTWEAAVQYAALLFATLPKNGDILFTNDAGSPLFAIEAAAIQSVQAANLRGSVIGLQFRFLGGTATSEDLPAIPEEGDAVKTKVVDLSAAETSKAVVYDSPFASTPKFVQATVSAPDGGTAIFAIPRESTRSASGITFDLTDAIPGAGYKLLVHAAL